MPLDNYVNQIQNQRHDREQKLVTNPRNWFSLIGLFPLQPGKNPLIGIPGIEPPENTFLELSGEKVYLVDNPGYLQINGGMAEARPLQTDHDADTDILSAGDVQMVVLQRGERFFIRAWNINAKAVKEFKGLSYYPVDPAWKIEGRFLRYPNPVIIPGEDAIGTKTETAYVGEVHFEIMGMSCSLIAAGDEEELLFNFTDLTAVDTTYPGGRFLITPVPVKDTIWLDFNLTRNWPCAYTPYATCPLPPPQNRLKIRVEAGEKRYH
jgi:hypothetical protein